MIEIKETNSTTGFVVPAFFERTESYRERYVDCSREELIDLCFHQLGMLEKIQGILEVSNRDLENHLGYNETMINSWSQKLE